jgi:hypothetical protein
MLEESNLYLYISFLLNSRPKLLDYTVDRKEMLYRSGDIFNWLANGSLKVSS